MQAFVAVAVSTVVLIILFRSLAADEVKGPKVTEKVSSWWFFYVVNILTIIIGAVWHTAPVHLC